MSWCLWGNGVYRVRCPQTFVPLWPYRSSPRTLSPTLHPPLCREELLSVPGMGQAHDGPRALAHAVSSPRVLFLDLVTLLVVLDLQVSVRLSW